MSGYYIQDRELNPPEELENECIFCGNECEENFCSTKCRIGYFND